MLAQTLNLDSSVSSHAPHMLLEVSYLESLLSLVDDDMQ